MEINKVQWRMIAKGEKLPCDSFLMKKDGTITSMATGAGVTVGQDAYYLPVEELRSFPKEESEDERIRKELIAEVKEQIDCIPVPDCRDKEDEKALKQLNKWLAWLEKQGEQILANSAKTCKDEQKPADFSDLRTWKYIVDAVWTEKEGIGQYLDSQFTEEVAKKLQKRFGNIEQKPWSEWDEKLVKNLISTLSNLYARNLIEKETKEKYTNLLKSIKDRVFPQPKQEWSEEDETVLNNLIYALANDKIGNNRDEYVDWLKDLKNRVLPKPAKWSEEDEYHKRQILRILKDNGCSRTLQERTEKWIEERLKSLRPQSQWKPSKEQMEYLAKAITTLGDEGDCKTASILNDLRVELKKLKG